MNTQVACLNLVLATAVFQTEYIIHDALLAVGHKPDETDGLILRALWHNLVRVAVE